MTRFRTTSRLLVAALALLLLLPLTATAAAQSARNMIEDRSKVMLTALVERREEFRAHPETMNAFIRGELAATFDNEYSARLVLGRHGRELPSAKVIAFADALSENLMRRYGKAMLEFDPDLEVRVLQETSLRGGKIVRVSSEIQRSTGSPVPVDYMLRPVDGGWKVFDVIVEGVSYVQTYRAQFEEVLRTQTLDQVIEGLKQEVPNGSVGG